MHYPTGDGSLDHHLAELYNLNDDPEETHNLINDPRHGRKLEELRKELARLIKAADGLPDRMPLDEGIKTALAEKSIR